MNIIIVWVKQIVIFGILSNVVIRLLPKDSYIKYVKLFTGLILIIITISPITNILNVDTLIYDFYSYSNSLQSQNDMKYQLMYAQESSYEQIIEPYRVEVITQIEAIVMKNNLYPVSTDVKFDTQDGSDTFGQITSISVSVSKKYKSEDKVSVDKIKIDSTNHIDKDRSINEINIKNEIADFYNVELNNINISMCG